jgi:hypothetical protein
MNTTTPLTPARCLHCGDAFEVATGTTSGRKPRGGDVAMCLTCGCFHVFNDDLTVRAPTRKEMRTMARSPSVQFAAVVHAAWRAQRQKH